MYKIFDVQCEECKKIEEIFIDDKEDFPTCSECEGEVKRIFTKFNFKLIYNNKTDMCAWGDNGYDSSQYWTKVKEAKAQGLDAHSPEE